MVLLIITVVALSCFVDLSGTKVVLGKTVLFGFMMLLCGSIYINAYYEIKNVYSAYNDRVAIIENAIASGETSVEIPTIRGSSGYSCYSPGGDLCIDSSVWPNTSIASYFDVNEIICVD